MRTRFSTDDAPESFIACQRLLAALLPPHRLRALLAASDGRPEAALEFSFDELTRRRDIALTEKQAERIATTRAETLPPNYLDYAGESGIWIVAYNDPAYPANLRPIMDAPALLCVRGSLAENDEACVAMVGSRRATIYGRGQADRFSRAFTQYALTIVSGGAAGIDTATHRGTLDAGGRTIAVLGCGVDVVYPAENRKLFGEIVASGGALLSEFALGTKPEPWRFPARNRIIAGMAKATVLIETPVDSGAMITARDAATYGREVWAVPGPVDGGRSRGCHRLIQDGAGLADSPADVLLAIGIETEIEQPTRSDARGKSYASAGGVGSKTHPEPIRAITTEPVLNYQPEPEPDLSDDEKALLTAFDATPRHADEAGVRSGLSAPQVSVALTLLEMKGLLRRQPGNLYVRISRLA